MDGPTLKDLRTRSGKSQRDIAQLLGIQNSTVTRWETDPTAVIPEPAKKLLELYFHGTPPFGDAPADPTRDIMPKLVLTLEEFEELQVNSRKMGFTDIRSYIVHMIRQSLKETPRSPVRYPLQDTPAQSLNEESLPPFSKQPKKLA